jgi:N-acetylmuramoyl-L-alanine amidase
MYNLIYEITPHLDRAGVSFRVPGKDVKVADRCKESNDLDTRFHLALHSNAGGNGKAWGPIAFYHTAGKTLAEKIIAEMLALGQESNRACHVQSGKHLYELKNTAAATCLVEVDFHDSEKGVAYITKNRAAIAEAIAKAVVAEDGKEWVEPSAMDSAIQDRLLMQDLFDPNDAGDYRWGDALTRREAVIAFQRLNALWKEGKP